MISGNGTAVEQEDGARQSFLMGNILQVDRHFLSTMQIPLVGGRDFLPYHPSDSSEGVLVNEAFVKSGVGWSDPVGKKVSYFPERRRAFMKLHGACGVTKDFNIYSSSTP